MDALLRKHGETLEVFDTIVETFLPCSHWVSTAVQMMTKRPCGYTSLYRTQFHTWIVFHLFHLSGCLVTDWWPAQGVNVGDSECMRVLQWTKSCKLNSHISLRIKLEIWSGLSESINVKCVFFPLVKLPTGLKCYVCFFYFVLFLWSSDKSTTNSLKCIFPPPSYFLFFRFRMTLAYWRRLLACCWNSYIIEGVDSFMGLTWRVLCM